MPMFHITTSHVDKPPVLPGLKPNPHTRKRTFDSISSESMKANEKSLPLHNYSVAFPST